MLPSQFPRIGEKESSLPTLLEGHFILVQSFKQKGTNNSKVCSGIPFIFKNSTVYLNSTLNLGIMTP